MKQLAWRLSVLLPLCWSRITIKTLSGNFSRRKGRLFSGHHKRKGCIKCHALKKGNLGCDLTVLSFRNHDCRDLFLGKKTAIYNHPPWLVEWEHLHQHCNERRGQLKVGNDEQYSCLNQHRRVEGLALEVAYAHGQVYYSTKRKRPYELQRWTTTTSSLKNTD